MIDKSDTIFSTYKYYRDLISEDAKNNDSFVYGIDQLAARLTVAHVIDDALRFLKNDKPPTAHKIVNVGNYKWNVTDILSDLSKEG